METRMGAEPALADTDPAASVDPIEKEPVKPAKILVAEDSPDNRLLVDVYLKGSPYQLTFEEDGKAALDRFATADFDLILMDVQMPVMDGIAATRAIRALERERLTPPIPIVALTANANFQDVEREPRGRLRCPLVQADLKAQSHRRHREIQATAETGGNCASGVSRTHPY